MIMSKTTVFVLVLVSFGLVNCGGGGGGGDSGVEYTGSTSQAVITDANKQELIETTVVSSGPGTSVGILSTGAHGENAADKAADVADTLSSAANSLIAGIHTHNFTTSEVQSGSDTIPGSCGGQFSFSIRYDDITGDFSGNISFSNYDDCDGGVLDGSSSFSGQLNVSTGDILNFNLAFSVLRFDDGTNSYEMSGSINFDGTTAILTLNFKDNTTEEVFRVEDFTVVDGFSGLTVSGRFFHSDHGYVDISTPTPLVFDFVGVPQSGVVLVEGSGSAARATFMSGGNYTLELDEDGDGSFDSTENCTWGGMCTAVVI